VGEASWNRLSVHTAQELGVCYGPSQSSAIGSALLPSQYRQGKADREPADHRGSREQLSPNHALAVLFQRPDAVAAAPHQRPGDSVWSYRYASCRVPSSQGVILLPTTYSLGKSANRPKCSLPPPLAPATRTGAHCLSSDDIG